MSVFKIIWGIGARLRNPSLFSYIKLLNETQLWSREKLLSYQFNECKSLLVFIGNHSPYYQTLFNEIGFDPQTDFKSLEDLKLIPVVDKSILIKNNEQFHTQYPFKKLFLSETSGSSGEPLTFYRNEEWDSFSRASIIRGYNWHNVYPWERNGYFWGYQLKRKERFNTKVLDFLQNRFRLFSYKEDGLKCFIKKLKKAKYLEGYSSMIYELAKQINKQEEKPLFPKLKMVKGTSEKVFETYQHEAKKAYGISIINEYGAAETGIIGFECKYGNIHVNMEGVIVETINGEVVITNIRSRSFPIIRYKLGDSIELDDHRKCDCGMDTPIISNIVGRVGKLIYGKKNDYPSLTLYYIFKDLALHHKINLNYQVIQPNKGMLEFRIEQKLNSHEKDKLIKTINQFFQKDIDFEIYQELNLHKMDGKLKDYISYVE